jgi:hypothetical protein
MQRIRMYKGRVIKRYNWNKLKRMILIGGLLLALTIAIMVVVFNAKAKDTRGNVSELTVGQAIVYIVQNGFNQMEVD